MSFEHAVEGAAVFLTALGAVFVVLAALLSRVMTFVVLYLWAFG